MQVRIFTLRFNPVTESFDDNAIAGFLADKDVLSIRDHFFVKDHIPYLTVVVRYRVPILPVPAEAAGPVQKRDESWRDKLTAGDLPLFNTLRSWRSEHAKQEGIPSYVICNNRQLAEVVNIRPQTLAVLGRIEGFGEAKPGSSSSDLINTMWSRGGRCYRSLGITLSVHHT